MMRRSPSTGWSGPSFFFGSWRIWCEFRIHAGPVASVLTNGPRLLHFSLWLPQALLCAQLWPTVRIWIQMRGNLGLHQASDQIVKKHLFLPSRTDLTFQAWSDKGRTALKIFTIGGRSCLFGSSPRNLTCQKATFFLLLPPSAQTTHPGQEPPSHNRWLGEGFLSLRLRGFLSGVPHFYLKEPGVDLEVICSLCLFCYTSVLHSCRVCFVIVSFWDDKDGHRTKKEKLEIFFVTYCLVSCDTISNKQKKYKYFYKYKNVNWGNYMTWSVGGA